MAMKVADYVLKAKAKAGDAHMSDRAFGEVLGGYSGTAVSDARYGNARIRLVTKLEDYLRDDGVMPGEILLAALAEKATDSTVRERLRGVAKRLASLPKKAAAAIGAVAVGLAVLHHEPALAGSGGVGRFRKVLA